MNSGEHKRAWDWFQQVYFVHAAAIEAFRLLHALPNGAEQLGGSIQTRYGFGLNQTSESAQAMAESLLEETQKDAAAGFQTVRSSALIAVCAAFEYLVKARFVDAALTDQESATNLLSTRKLGVKLDLIEVLGLPASEQWFAIADELFKKAGDGGRPMSERVRLMLLDYIDMHPVGRAQREKEMEQQLLAVTTKRFNLAFLARHCFVHNGGRVNRALSRATDRSVGHEVVLTDQDFRGLIAAVREVAESASPYFLLSLD
jgi:hypothetical protein